MFLRQMMIILYLEKAVLHLFERAKHEKHMICSGGGYDRAPGKPENSDCSRYGLPSFGKIAEGEAVGIGASLRTYQVQHNDERDQSAGEEIVTYGGERAAVGT